MLQVLLIDDNPTQLQVRQAVLEQAGMSVATAETAESAIDRLRNSANRFHVIVTDHMLAGDNGASFVRQLRAINPDIPVLAISGLPGAEEEYEKLNVCFLPKPVPPEELIQCVRELGGSSSSGAAAIRD
jgi:CheY-like chemotaxis protein